MHKLLILKLVLLIGIITGIAIMQSGCKTVETKDIPVYLPGVEYED